MTRILLVDDHAIVREGFKRLVDREPGLAVVGEAASRLDALPLLAATTPDLLITDLTLADGTGMALIDDVARHHSTTRTLVLSMHMDTAFVAEALQRGARGYVSKGAGADELVLAIHAIMRGEQYLSRDLRPVRRATHPVESLTPRERQTLQLLVRGLVPKAAAAELGISEKTLYAHRASLLEKLGARNDRDLSRIALERGLL
jgi:two-component system, NarL family, response regulator FusR